MGRWFFALGGLAVWFIHFMGIYAIASLADTVARADDLRWRMVSLAFSVLCALGVLVLLVLAVRKLASRDQGEGQTFMDELGVLAAGLALVAIVWQAAPNLIGY